MVRIARAVALLLLAAATAQAHLIVDMKVSVRAPAFAAKGAQYSFEVVADDLANDNGIGISVASPVPTGATFVSFSAPSDFNCNQSKGVVTCAAEQLGPGEHVITIKATAPAQTGAITAKAHVTSLGSTDLQPNNDDASASTTIYDPARCTAAAPALLSPADGAVLATQPAQFAWTPSADGARYVVHASVEGAGPAAISATTSTVAAAPLDRGSGTWWVEATFTDCPPAESPHRAVTMTRAPSVALLDLATNFHAPAGLVFGPNGELYVTDEEDAVVRQVSQGVVNTISGTFGEQGAADGQFARFNHPTGITVTPLDGYIYVADTNNDAVRILYTGGPFVPAFALLGTQFRAPQAVAATLRGSLYVADTGNGAVQLMTPVSGTTGIFNTTPVAQFTLPAGIAVGADKTLYVAEQSNGTIVKLAPNGDRATLATGFARPAALALDALGNLYVCDRATHVLSKVAPSGLVTPVATFGDPAGVAVAADGSVYVADEGNHAVRRVIVTTETPPPSSARRRAANH
jgi:DNA-binding beta-propeller fold protein YncE